MTFIALDDEPLALVLIKKLAEQTPEWDLLATFTDATSALEFLRGNPVDLLLTDINMPDISGLELVRDLPEERPMVIFLTAYKEHALAGYDLDVVDYLVKPVSKERFVKAMKKAAEWLNLRERAEAATVPAEDEFFYVHSEYQQVKVVIKDILYIESMGDYVKIHLEGQPKPILTLQRLKHLAEKLAENGFIRIHRSYLVNLAKVEAKQKARLRVGGIWLPVGETYADSIPDH